MGRNTKTNTKTKRNVRTNLKRAKKEDEMWRNTKRKKKSAGMDTFKRNPQNIYDTSIIDCSIVKSDTEIIKM